MAFLFILEASFALEVSAQELNPVTLFVHGGFDIRLESTVNPEIKEPLAAGILGFYFRYKEYGFLQELGYLKKSSSSGNFEISYQTFEFNQWAHYMIPNIVPRGRPIKPYFGVGLGLSQNRVKTTLASTSRSDSSRIFVNAGAAGGLLIEASPRLDFIAEARAWKFEQKKDPMFSGLLAIRFQLNNY